MEQNDKYLNIRGDVKATCDNFSANRASLSSDLTNILSSFDGINYSGCSDWISEGLKANLDACKSQYKDASNAVDTVLIKVEQIYKGLDQALKDLDDVNKLYDETMKLKPNKANYIIATQRFMEVFGQVQPNTSFEVNSSYYDDLALWEQKMAEIEEKASALRNKIDAYLSQLSEINNCDTLSSATAKCSTMVVVPHVSITQNEMKVLNYREAFYDARNAAISDKISLDELGMALGYTKEEIIDELIINNRFNWDNFCESLPDDFRNLMNIETKLFTGSQTEYQINGKKDISFYDAYVSNVSIDGKNVEILQLLDSSKKGFIYDLDHCASKASIIDNISTYPDKMFDVIAKEDVKIVMIDDINQIRTSEEKAEGMYHTWGEHVVFIDQYESKVGGKFITDHEFSHRFDNLSGNQAFSESSKASVEDMYNREFAAVSSLNNHSKIYKNQDTKSYERFAESGALYLNYSEEMRDFSPEMYNYYQGLFGSIRTNPRSIKDMNTNEVIRNTGAPVMNRVETKNKVNETRVLGSNKTPPKTENVTASNSKKSGVVGVTVTKGDTTSSETSPVKTNVTSSNNSRKTEGVVVSEKVNTDNTTIKSPPKPGESVVIGTSSGKEKTVLSEPPKQEKTHTPGETVVIGSAKTVKEPKPAPPEERKESYESHHTPNPSNGSVIIDERSVKSHSDNANSNTSTNKNTNSNNVHVHEENTIRETKGKVETVRNSDGSVTINIPKADSNIDRKATNNTGNIIEEKTESIAEPKVPLRTEYNQSTGTVTIYLPDGSIQVVYVGNHT